MSAQKVFFQSLTNVLGDAVKTSCPSLVFADSEMNCYFDSRIPELLKQLRVDLGATVDGFSSRPLPVDGMLYNHSVLGTRVVEFDECQHFTLERLKTIICENRICPLAFHQRYYRYFNESDVMAMVNRTTQRIGFRRAARGFNCAGGRTKQRAYFDVMKDYIHLSERGREFRPIIRFAISDFDVVSTQAFQNLNGEFIQNRIRDVLRDYED